MEGVLDLRRLFQKNMHKATQVVDSSEVLGESPEFLWITLLISPLRTLLTRVDTRFHWFA